MRVRHRRRTNPGSGVAAKLAAVVVVFAMVAGGLLAVRQQRVKVASDLMRTHIETEQAMQATLRLRSEIAAGETINRVRQMATAGADLVPLAFVRATEPPAHPETEPASNAEPSSD